MDNDTYDDRTNIRFLKQEEFNANIVKRLEELEDKMAVAYTRIKGTEDFVANTKVEDSIRFDQGIENRTKAFDRIEELKEDFKLLEQYTVKGLTDSLRELQYNVDVKLERIDDILVVHKNQTDNQRKNFCALRKVLDDKVMDLLEKGEHGEHK